MSIHDFVGYQLLSKVINLNQVSPSGLAVLNQFEKCKRVARSNGKNINSCLSCIMVIQTLEVGQIAVQSNISIIQPAIRTGIFVCEYKYGIFSALNSHTSLTNSPISHQCGWTSAAGACSEKQFNCHLKYYFVS